MNIHLSKLRNVCLCASLLGMPAISSASNIAGNLGGSAPGYDTTTGNLVGNDFGGDNLAHAVEFTPTQSGIVKSIQVALSCFAPSLCPDNLTISLDNNNGGSPGAALETFMVSGTTLGISGDPNPTVVLTSSTNPLLGGGTTYWLSISDNSGADTGVWNLNQTGDMSNTAVSQDGGVTWLSPAGETPGAYEIDGTLVPEPSSIALVFGSGLLLGFLRKYRRQ